MWEMKNLLALAALLALTISPSFGQHVNKTINVKKTAWVRKGYVTKTGKYVPAKVVQRRTNIRKVKVH